LAVGLDRWGKAEETWRPASVSGFRGDSRREGSSMIAAEEPAGWAAIALLVVGGSLAGTDENPSEDNPEDSKNHSITALAFAPDGKTFVSAGRDGLAQSGTPSRARWSRRWRGGRRDSRRGLSAGPQGARGRWPGYSPVGSRHGQKLATWTEHRACQLFDVQSGRQDAGLGK